MEIQEAIRKIESSMGDPQRGLPEDVFLFASRLTPMVNVDLLIKDELNRTLLTWREDGYCAPGWHVPGGIIRFKETISSRVIAVARQEVGVEVEFDSTPLAVNEVIHPTRPTRGHFISLLIRCSLRTQLDKRFRCITGQPRSGEWMWHDRCPENIISVHEMYRQYF